MMTQAPQPEFSFAVEMASLPAGGRRYAVAADEPARARVAERLGLVEVKSLLAHFDLTPRAVGIVQVKGVVEAAVTQTCVVSLAPISAHITEEVDVRFTAAAGPKPSAKAAGKGPADEEEEIDFLSEEEPPEEARDGQVDLGELAVVHLALGLDPYPRAKGVSFHIPPAGQKDEKSEVGGPFAVLAQLKKKDAAQRG